MSYFKVLLLDGIDPAGIDVIQQTGSIAPIVHDKISREKLLEMISEVDGVVVRSATNIDRELLEKATQLKVVGRAGVGVDNVDVEAATEHGILVMNTPAGNTIATAELTFTHLLCGARPVPQAAASMKAGQWDRKSFSGIELFKKT